LEQMLHDRTFISLVNRLFVALSLWNWRDGRSPQTLVPSLVQSQMANAAIALHFPNSRLSGTVYVQWITYQQC
jgi:hypothetical protein